MSHYITIPVNENGLIVDVSMDVVIQEAIDPHPFGYQDVYIYSHGWSTDATRALDLYNQFSVELARLILIQAKKNPLSFHNGPRETLGVGIHWPSEITEDEDSPLNKLQLFTFYTMEKRAHAVGEHAVYSAIRLMLDGRDASLPIRFNLLGHSFGCRVVAAALSEIAKDCAAGKALPAGTQFNVVLLQGATDSEDLATDNCYGPMATLPTRVLTTFSSLDQALNQWYIDAGMLANLFRTPRAALGAKGPGPQTLATYASSAALTVGPGFTHDIVMNRSERLIVADLSPVHAARPDANASFTGHHSDILFNELYELIAGFFFA